MQRFVAYYQYQLNGYINVNVWPDDPDAMYPEMWHQKFDGYSLEEVQNIIKDELKKRYNKVKVIWERQR